MKSKGFTVIELSIVLILMGLVALIFLNIFPKVQSYAAHKKTLRILDSAKEDLESRYKSGALRRFQHPEFDDRLGIGRDYYYTGLTDDAQGTPPFRDGDGGYLGYIPAPVLVNNDICATNIDPDNMPVVFAEFCLDTNCNNMQIINNIGLVLFANEPDFINQIGYSENFDTANNTNPVVVTFPPFGENSEQVFVEGASGDINAFINSSNSNVRIFTVQALKMMANCPTLDRQAMNIQLPDATAGQLYQVPLPIPLSAGSSICLESTRQTRFDDRNAADIFPLPGDPPRLRSMTLDVGSCSGVSGWAAVPADGVYQFSLGSTFGDPVPTNPSPTYTEKFVLHERFFGGSRMANTVTIKHNIVVNVVAP